MRYVDYILDSLAPPWLQDGNGCAWMTGLGEEKDFLKQRIIDSIALRFPTYAPADGAAANGGIAAPGLAPYVSKCARMGA